VTVHPPDSREGRPDQETASRITTSNDEPSLTRPTINLPQLTALIGVDEQVRGVDVRVQAPVLSGYTRAILAEEHQLDLRLMAEANVTISQIRAEVAAMDADQVEQVLMAGYRWRHYWRPDQVQLREELEGIARRRLDIESSHEISRMVGDRSQAPSFADLQRLRAVPVTPVPCHGCDRCKRCDQFLGRCRQVVSIGHPLPRPLEAWCARHMPGSEKPAYCLQHRPDEGQVAA
jgi:hypothetical protein